MLFKKSDIDLMGVGIPDNEKANATAIRLKQHIRFLAGDKMDVLERTVGELEPGISLFFKTDGAWSSAHLLEYVLMQTGPADVYLTTWSISADTLARFAEWQRCGTIKKLTAVLDSGIRNRKPEVYQQATGVFPGLKVCHIHAKVTVVSSVAGHHITIMGSPNYTRNPRIETGIIIWDKSLADENIKWILEEFNK